MTVTTNEFSLKTGSSCEPSASTLYIYSEIMPESQMDKLITRANIIHI